VDLKDATLMFLVEAASYPAVAQLAQAAYDRLAAGEDVDYRLLNELIEEASGQGVLRDLRRKHGPVAFEAIIGPVLREIGRRAPIRSSREYTWQPGDDPLTAGLPPRAGSTVG
jgi:hypothetical protein